MPLVPAVLLVCALLAARATEQNNQQTQKERETLVLPWLLAEQPSFMPSYLGLHNSLIALSENRARDKWVTIFIYNDGVRRWALNCLYALIKYGKVDNYIAAVTDESSLQACIKAKLPCLNASYTKEEGAKLDRSQAYFGSRAFLDVGWGKVKLLRDLLDAGKHVLIMDVDIVVVRDVFASLGQVFNSMYGGTVDMVAMREDSPGGSLINTGFMAMQNTQYSKFIVQKWLTKRSVTVQDQPYLNRQAYKHYVTCDVLTACFSAREKQWPTIYRHPSQVNDLVSNNVCPTKTTLGPHCSQSRLYIHAICYAEWDKKKNKDYSKEGLFESMDAVLVDEDGKPLWADPEAGGSSSGSSRRERMAQQRRDFQVNVGGGRGGGSLPQHPHYPCSGLAWSSDRFVFA